MAEDPVELEEKELDAIAADVAPGDTLEQVITRAKTYISEDEKDKTTDILLACLDGFPRRTGKQI